MDWTTPNAYLEAVSLLDIDYCRMLHGGCLISHQSAYDWIYFLDSCGVEDDGDFYTHTQYPEPRA